MDYFGLGALVVGLLIFGLAYAPNATLTEATSAAVQVFVQNAQRVQPSFMLDARNLAAALRICQLVEGMPLSP